MADSITLPDSIEDIYEREVRERDEERAVIHEVAAAKARARTLDALAGVREKLQGVSVAEQQNQATEALDDLEAAYEERIERLDKATQNAQRDRVQEATIDILAGMVARLMADQ